jgi:2-oxoisovalerate dehydrogenase E1 component
VISGDGTEPAEAARLLTQAVGHVRSRKGPALLRLTVPRLQGHSFQDTQTYKSEDVVASEWARDPLPKLRSYLVPALISEEEWARIETDAAEAVEQARATAEARGIADPETVMSNVFYEGEMQQIGGQWTHGYKAPPSHEEPRPEGQRINMVTAIRRTLDRELEINPRVLLFGEDIGPKGGVHAVTLGLQDKYGIERVFDTSLNEEGIIGRAVGMALAGLMPVPEIQFRKYAEPATEQINDCGTMRWRTANRFAAPMVLRIPGGFFKVGDPWHSQTNEVQFVHNPGWLVAVPSNAEDAVGLLRAGLRGNDPVIFFEHRSMLDDVWARRPYPGDDYVLPFGRAKKTRAGDDISIVTWGAMVPRCEEAAKDFSADVIDLRTLMPWDKEMVLESVRRTRRCLIVHEDLQTGGFGAEIAAVVADEAFLDLDAPVARVTMPDIPSPHNPVLLNWAVPSVDRIRAKIDELVGVLMIDVIVPLEQEGTQAVVRAWLKKVGDRVETNEPLCELETDKVAVEVPAPAAGVLREIVLNLDAEAVPGAVLGRIAAFSEGENIPLNPFVPSEVEGRWHRLLTRAPRLRSKRTRSGALSCASPPR